MVAIIAISLIAVAVVFGIILYSNTKSWKIVGYSYQSLFAFVALVMSLYALEGLLKIITILISLGLLINGLMLLKFKK
jgi:hypothetical protein